MQNEVIEFEAITRQKDDAANTTHVLVVELMAQENKVREGNEGLNSISINGISESYKDGYSKRICSLLDSIKKRVKLL